MHLLQFFNFFLILLLVFKGEGVQIGDIFKGESFEIEDNIDRFEIYSIRKFLYIYCVHCASLLCVVDEVELF